MTTVSRNQAVQIEKHMKKLVASLAMLMLFLPGYARAESYPVVVELFTAQGCSACPPADAFLTELSKRKDVIPLALHVDYWDYLGWPDSFASKTFSNRQRAYARAHGKHTIFTPQMIIQGSVATVGSRADEVMRAISTRVGQPSELSLDVVRKAGMLRISLSTAKPGEPCVIVLVRYDPAREITITAGENAGRHMRYTNVVTQWEVIGEWNGQGKLQIERSISGDQPVVVLVQAKGLGPILAARVLR